MPFASKTARWKWAIGLVLGLPLLTATAGFALLQSLDRTALVQAAAQSVESRTGRQLTVAGPTDITFFPTLGIRLADVSLSDPRSPEVFASVESVQVGLAVLPLLSGEAQVKALSVEGANVRVVKDVDGRFNFDDLLALGKTPEGSNGQVTAPDGDKTPAAGPPMAFRVDAIRLRNLGLVYQDKASGLQATLSQVSLSTGAIAPGRASPLDVRGMLRTNQPALALQVGLAGELLFTVGSQGRADLSKLTIDLETQLGSAAAHKTRLEGAAGIDLATQRIRADLRTAALDLDALTAKPAPPLAQVAQVAQVADVAAVGAAGPLPVGAASAGTYNAGSASSENSPIDLSGLQALNLDLALAVGELKAANLQLSEVSAKVLAQSGTLRADPISAKAYGGTVKASLSAQAAGQRLSARANFDGIQINPLLIALANKDILEGQGQLVLNLNTSGRSIRGFKSNLAGTASVDLRDGAVKGINLAERVRVVQGYLGSAGAGAAAAGPGRADTDKAASSPTAKTDFTAMAMGWQISQGIARSNDLNLMSPLFRIGGEGEVNIPLSTVNYLVNAKVVNTITGQDGKPLEKTRGITVPVRVKGPFTAVDWEIDTQALLKANLQSQIDQQKERLGGKANEAVGNALKNLLKR